jgi:hypothetical protein
MAELCSLENAFPNIGKGSGAPFVGGTDGTPTKEERRANRKLKKCRKTFQPDPDRQVARMEEVEEAMDQPEPVKRSEPFVDVKPKAACYPSYFGKGVDDEEGFSSYSAAAGDDPNYRLEPDVTSTFDARGVHKAMGVNLPDPNLSDRWKPLTESNTTTAFGDLPTAGSARPGWASIDRLEEPERIKTGPMNDDRWVSKDDKDVILQKMNMLVGRLDEIDKRRLQNTQTELLMFVGTGVLLLFTLDMLTRR